MRTVLIFSLICTVIFAGCGGDSATAEIVKKLNSSYDYDGKEVELVGYIAIASGRAGGMMVVNDKVSAGMVNSSMQQRQDAFAEVKLNFGQNPNCLWLPEKFQLSDAEIYDSNGQKHGINTKFAIKGVVHYTHKDWEKDTVAEEKSDKMKIFGIKTQAEKAEEAKQAAEERRKKTGDPNDYSFTFEATSISVAK
ncbi:MAG: hypothetical protein LBD45_09545 [Bacteroidales bacterium]|jgi:hypothetical protein|nr:hypothetical protein [Bacteroidales bacterium]